MATAVVLSLPELLERVLSFLSPRDCLRTQLVSTLFRDVITTSSTLQKSLFIKAEDAGSLRLVPDCCTPGEAAHHHSWILRSDSEIERERSRAFTGPNKLVTILTPARLNPLTRLCYDHWKIHLEQRGDAGGSLEIVQRGRFLVIDQWRVDPQIEFHDVWDAAGRENWLKDRLVSLAKREALGRFPNAPAKLADSTESWQAMHLTQPPTYRVTLLLFVTKAPLAGSLPPAALTYWERVHNDDGVRLGQVFALLSEIMKHAGDSVLKMHTAIQFEDVVDLTGGGPGDAE